MCKIHVQSARRYLACIFLLIAQLSGSSLFAMEQEKPPVIDWPAIEASLKEPGLAQWAFDIIWYYASAYTPEFIKGTLDTAAPWLLESAVQFETVRSVVNHFAFVSDNKIFARYDQAFGVHKVIPRQSVTNIKDLLIEANKEREHWELGNLSGAIYDGRKEHVKRLSKFLDSALTKDPLNIALFEHFPENRELATMAEEYFGTANPLHGTVFPLAVKAIRELGFMFAKLFNSEHAIISSSREAPRLGLRALKQSVKRAGEAQVHALVIDDDAPPFESIFEKAAGSLNIKTTRIGLDTLKNHPTFYPAELMVAVLTKRNYKEIFQSLLWFDKITHFKIHLHFSNELMREALASETVNLFVPFLFSSVSSLSFDSAGLVFNSISATIFKDATTCFNALEAHTSWEQGGMYPGMNSAGSIAGGPIIAAYAMLLHMGMPGLKGLATLTAGLKKNPDYKRIDLHSSEYAKLIDAFVSQSEISFSGLPEQPETMRDSLEALLVDLNLIVFNASKEHHIGRITSGGTESIRLAVQLYADRFRAQKANAKKKPIFLMTDMAHVAFHRQIKDMDATIEFVATKNSTIDPEKLIEQLKHRTDIAAIIISAPSYPCGLGDSIEAIAAIAQHHKIPLHVDACLGGFIHPFVPESPLKIDWSNKKFANVSSISCDLHKYGVSSKGLSAFLVLRELINDLGHNLETICQERSVATLEVGISCMLYEGKKGYEQRARAITDLGAKLAAAVVQISDLEMVEGFDTDHAPHFVIAFRLRGTLRSLTYALADLMSKRGWHIKQVGNYTLHFALTNAHVFNPNFLNDFSDDLKKAVAIIGRHPSMKKSSSVGLYGMAADLPELNRETFAVYVRMLVQLYAENLVKLSPGK